ncbi:GDP-L-fucose synthase [Acuticoccus sp. I52.16.1]|uniref:GDP-L-fucose synthase n=1 Tax=Acuticoccus sp. I52.16.1 TaxID=2928472 RepID=UPI002738C2E9|nr:GDP-L-fucose synthase [Acuticoccus sp. I52.16.1]
MSQPTSPEYSLAGKRVWVAGHRGMVGGAIVRQLQERDVAVLTASRTECDLRDAAAVARWMEANRPDAVVIAAAKVGGILANDTYPVDFLQDNLLIQTNIIKSAFDTKVEKLLFLGSSCIYPKFADQPITEDSLLTGPLEPTNEWYAIAKIAGIKLAQAYQKQYGCRYISAMPTNLYGPGDNFDLSSSHVIPALMRKAHQAKVDGAPGFEVWGSGTPRREFLHVDDLARGCVFLLEHYEGFEHVNIGSGTDLPIRDLALEIARVVGCGEDLTFDRSKPDGTPRKLMSGDRIAALGWAPQISLAEGLASTYRWFLENADALPQRTTEMAR